MLSEIKSKRTLKFLSCSPWKYLFPGKAIFSTRDAILHLLKATRLASPHSKFALAPARNYKWEYITTWITPVLRVAPGIYFPQTLMPAGVLSAPLYFMRAFTCRL